MRRDEARLRELGLWPAHGLLPAHAPSRPVAAPATVSPAGQDPARHGAPVSVSAASRVLAIPVAAPAPLGRESPPPAPTLDAAARPSIDTLDWAALETAIRACEACGLCRSRKQAVPGTGSRNARVLVVGEAPGAEEDQRGEPFVGRAGELLDQMLLAVGLDRRRVYIANVLKCRPPENRNPAPDEVAACSPFLARQIALLQPAVILALGSFAARALLGGEGKVGALRGGEHRYGDIPVVVSYHPAYLLRSPQEKLRAWEDLCRLQDALVAAQADSASLRSADLTDRKGPAGV